MSQPGRVLAWWPTSQSNKPPCGGARQCGNQVGSTEGSCLSRWMRIFSITAGSSMQAMILTAPPQTRQVARSMPNTRIRRCAHVIDARRVAPAPLRWCHQGAVLAVRREHPPWRRVRLTQGLVTSPASQPHEVSISDNSPWGRTGRLYLLFPNNLFSSLIHKIYRIWHNRLPSG